MKRKGFTLVELLVVIAIIALLMGILMPALAQVRRIAQRMMCGTNLSGLGKAIIVYSNDNEEEFPRAGGRASVWSSDQQILDWDAEDERDAFGDPPGADATIGSCWYLLVKYADVTPKQFICKGDVGAKVFKLSDYDVDPQVEDLTQVWDFGDEAPGMHYSYSYHLPFRTNNGTFPLSASSNPASPVASDRNPYLDKNAQDYLDGQSPDEDPPEWDRGEYIDNDKTGNAAPHQREGQNVLYVDSHVEFEKYPNCGIENDNIFKHWTGTPSSMTQEDKQLGNTGVGAAGNPSESKIGNQTVGPRSEEDAFLVSEWNEE